MRSSGAFVLQGASRQLEDLAGDSVLSHAAGLDGQAAELIERPGQDFFSGSALDRQAFAIEGAEIEGGATVDDNAVHRDPRLGLDDDAVADVDLAGEDVDFLTVAQQPAAPRKDLDEQPHGPPGALEGEAFQALAEQADEDDLGGDQRFAGQDGRDDGQGQGQVGTEATLEESFQRSVKSPHAAEDGCDQGDAEAEQFARPGGQTPAAQRFPGRQDGPEVGADDQRQQAGEQVESQVAFGLKGLVGVGDFAVHEAENSSGLWVTHSSLSDGSPGFVRLGGPDGRVKQGSTRRGNCRERPPGVSCGKRYAWRFPLSGNYTQP